MYQIQYRNKAGEWVTWATAINIKIACQYHGLMKFRFSEYKTRVVRNAGD